MKRFTMLLGAGMFSILCSMILALVPSVAEGDVPKLVNFQGILKDGSGNPVADGSYFVTLRIYDLPAAGTILWADTQTVATADGLFNAVLGTGTPVPDTVFNDSVRYLGITVFPDAEMTPRQRLTTSGYSFRSGEWTTLGENLFRLNGNVGIGETAPFSKLHIQRMDMSLPSAAALLNEDIIIEDDDAVLGLYSGTGGGFGSAISLGEIDAGSYTNKWSIYRTKTLSGAKLGFSFGPDTNYGANPTLMILDGPNSRIGVGTTSPSAETKLHIRHFDLDNFGLLIDAHGVSGTEIGLHAGPLAYGSLAKNTYFNSGWQRFNTANGAFLQEIEPDGDVLFRTAPSGANPISWNEALMLKSGGNIGINEPNPLAKLHVQRLNLFLPSTAALLNEDIIIEDDDAVLGLYSGTGGTFGSAISLGEINAGVFADKWTMYRTKNLAGAKLGFAYGTDTSYAGNPALVTLDGPNGKMGVGTTVPSAESKLHIRHFDGDNFGLLVDAHGTSGTEIGLHTGPSGYASLAKNTYFNAGWQRFDAANGAFLQEVEPDGDVLFRTAPATVNPITWNNPLFFSAGGKVGIGTTSVYADANTNLTLSGSLGYKSGTSPMLYIYESGTQNQTKRVISHSPGFPTFGLIYNDSTDDFYFSGTGLGIGTSAPAALLHVAGTAGNNTGVWSNLSDRRLKKEIEPISGALESVLQLKGVTFRWKDEGMDAEFGRVRGLVAQDVEKVLPEWIKTDPDGYKRLEPIGIDALLIEAIKELKAENDELKDRILKLEQAKPQAKVE